MYEHKLCSLYITQIQLQYLRFLSSPRSSASRGCGGPCSRTCSSPWCPPWPRAWPARPRLGRACAGCWHAADSASLRWSESLNFFWWILHTDGGDNDNDGQRALRV